MLVLPTSTFISNHFITFITLALETSHCIDAMVAVISGVALIYIWKKKEILF